MREEALSSRGMYPDFKTWVQFAAPVLTPHVKSDKLLSPICEEPLSRIVQIKQNLARTQTPDLREMTSKTSK